MHGTLQTIRKRILDRHLPMIDTWMERNMKDHDEVGRQNYHDSVRNIYTLAVETTLDEVNGMHERREINLNR